MPLHNAYTPMIHQQGKRSWPKAKEELRLDLSEFFLHVLSGTTSLFIILYQNPEHVPRWCQLYLGSQLPFQPPQTAQQAQQAFA